MKFPRYAGLRASVKWSDARCLGSPAPQFGSDLLISATTEIVRKIRSEVTRKGSEES